MDVYFMYISKRRTCVSIVLISGIYDIYFDMKLLHQAHANLSGHEESVFSRGWRLWLI